MGSLIAIIIVLTVVGLLLWATKLEGGNSYPPARVHVPETYPGASETRDRPSRTPTGAQRSPRRPTRYKGRHRAG